MIITGIDDSGDIFLHIIMFKIKQKKTPFDNHRKGSSKVFWKLFICLAENCRDH